MDVPSLNPGSFQVPGRKFPQFPQPCRERTGEKAPQRLGVGSGWRRRVFIHWQLFTDLRIGDECGHPLRPTSARSIVVQKMQGELSAGHLELLSQWLGDFPGHPLLGEPIFGGDGGSLSKSKDSFCYSTALRIFGQLEDTERVCEAGRDWGFQHAKPWNHLHFDWGHGVFLKWEVPLVYKGKSHYSM